MSQKYLNLYLDSNKVLEEDNERAVAWLKNTLQTMGVEIRLDKGEYSTRLSISYDTGELRKKQTRNAGRKASHEFEYRVCDVRDLIKEKGAVQAAKELGMSKARMYARLKKAAEREDDYL